MNSLPPAYDLASDDKQIDSSEPAIRECKMCGRMDVDYYAGTNEHEACKDEEESPTDKVLSKLFSNPLK